MKLNSLLILIILLNSFCLSGNEQPGRTFIIKKIAELPKANSITPNPGVAGAFSGITGNKLIIAGGANFPEKKPWEGGIKTFHDRIYIYTLSNDSLILVEGNWSLPRKLAYGTSVTLQTGVMMIGGNDIERCYKDVYLLKWDAAGNNLNTEIFPELPVPLSNASAVLLDNSVYLIGGSATPDAVDSGNHFLKLDLSRRNMSGFAWEVLPPFPGPGRVYAVSAVQSNGTRRCIYLFSGRNIGKNNEIQVFRDGMVYDPELLKWETLPASSKDDFPVMAGIAFPSGTSDIVFAGGAPGDLFIQQMDLTKQLAYSTSLHDTALISKSKNALVGYFMHHPGFSKNILVYNTITRTITNSGEFEGFCPVTTNAVPYKNGVIITCGEIKPGIRTPDIIMIRHPVQLFRWLNSIIFSLCLIILAAVGYIVSKNKKVIGRKHQTTINKIRTKRRRKHNTMIL
jgi:cyclically-permuted mutarotase family protein